MKNSFFNFDIFFLILKTFFIFNQFFLKNTFDFFLNKKF